MIRPQVSVLMPVYKVELSWLDESIKSILEQTYDNFEFVIVNDGAPQDVTDRLREWKAQDKRIVLIEQENQGCHGALNSGLKFAKNEFVARMDSDDVALPDRLEKQVEFMLNNPKVEILNTAKYSYAEGSFFPCFIQKESYWLGLMGFCCINHPAVMYKRSSILGLGGYDEDMLYAEDYALWSKAVKKNVVIDGLNIPLLRYREKDGDYAEYFKIQTATADRVQIEYLKYMLGKFNLYLDCEEGSLGTLCKLVLYNFMTILSSYLNVENREELIRVARLVVRRVYGAYKRVNTDSVWEKIKIFCIYQKVKFILRLMKKGLL